MPDLVAIGEVPVVIHAGDAQVFAKLLEEQAAVGARIQNAIHAMLMSCTYPQDWTEQGGKMCLSSAGAERIGARFNVSYDSPDVEKQEFTDEHGPGYLYIFTGSASLNHGGSVRKVYTEGRYGTRDKFLGFAGGRWRNVAEINESNIRAAAYHMWCGNAVKALLGIRNLPAAEFRELMQRGGRKSEGAAKVSRGEGTQGGTAAGDSDGQKRFAEIMLALADAACTSERTESGDWKLSPISDSDARDRIQIAQATCQMITGLDSAKKLHGAKLEAALAAAKELAAQLKGVSDQ